MCQTVRAAPADVHPQEGREGAGYYQVVEGYRDFDWNRGRSLIRTRVRHRTVISLGKCPTVAEAIEHGKRDRANVARELDERERASGPPRSRIARLRSRLTRHETRLAKLEEIRGSVGG